MKSIKNTLSWLFTTKLAGLAVSFFFMFIFAFLSKYYDWANIMVYICWVYPIGLALVMFAYGWVINPLRDYKERKKKRENK